MKFVLEKEIEGHKERISQVRRAYYRTAKGRRVHERAKNLRRNRKNGFVSWRRVAEELQPDAKEYPSPTGKPWTASMAKYAGTIDLDQRRKRRPRERINEEDVLMPAEVERCLNILDYPPYRGLYMIFITALGSGLRNSELCGLRKKDLLLKDGKTSLRVRGKGAVKRVVEISDWLARQLRVWVKDDAAVDPVFVNKNGGPLDRHGMARRMKQIAEIAGLDKSFHCHCLRHTFASVLWFYLRDHFEVRQQLGHTSSSTTEIYIHTPYSRKNLDMTVFAKLFRVPERKLF